MTTTAAVPDREQLEQMVMSAECSDDFQRRGLGNGGLRETEWARAFEDLIGDETARSEFDQMSHDRSKELRRFRDESKHEASVRASQASGRLEALVKGRRGLIDDAVPDTDGVAPWVPESTPVLFIRSTPGGVLRDSQIADGDTWAKWESAASGGAIKTVADERVGFFYLWQNPTRRQMLVDIVVGLTLRGHLSCEAEGMGFPAGLFWDVSRSDVSVGARLSIWPLWLSGVADERDSVSLVGTSAGGAVFGDASSASVATSTELRTSRYLVPREGFIMIEASAVAGFSCMSGDAEADFASKDSFRVDSSYCFVILPG